MAPSEEALMRAYVAGSRKAFTRLFDRLAPAVHAFFLRSLRNRTLAEDLVQATFLNVHRARHRWDPARPVRPWVFTIAAHVRDDALRRDGRPAEEDEELAAAEGEAARERAAPDAEVALFRKTRAERVRDAIDRLPEAQRSIVHLHRFEGLSFAEIAAALGTTEGAVKLRAFRAYGRLRTALADLLREDA
jgi:RNA polymerase sigma-70 factor (ECF subfamily)